MLRRFARRSVAAGRVGSSSFKLSRRTLPALAFRRTYADQSLDHGVQHLGVIGAGQMGAGIAQVAAVHAKLPVTLVDASAAQIEKSMQFMEKLLSKDVSKGRLTDQDKSEALSRISTATSLEALSESDFVVEAVTENVELKASLFSQLSEIVPSGGILASNTSSISITKIAASSDRIENVIGMHFMNPVPVMKLVEIITGLGTSEETLRRTHALASAMGKVTTQSKDVPGFIANRLLMPYINEAIFALQEGIGTREDIDTTMKLGTNMPMGPLTLADFIGLDTCLSIMRVLHTQLGDTKYRPSPLLIQYIDAGFLGKKSGRGFYTY